MTTTGDGPERSPDGDDPRRSPKRRFDLVQRPVGGVVAVLAAAVAGGRKRLRPPARAEIAEEAGGDDDHRERHPETEDADESGGGDGDRGPASQRSPRHPHHRFENDGKHRRLQAEEDGLEPADAVEEGIERGKHEDDGEAGEDEERAGDDAATRAVEEPADIGGELLGLGTGEQHAEIQRMQEPVLRYPLSLVDEHAVHEGDLPGGPAEAKEADGRPDLRRLAEGRVAERPLLRLLRRFGHGFLPFAVGQLWASSTASRAQR